MPALSRDGIFGDDLHLGFDGRFTCVSHLGVEDDQVAGFDGMVEDHRVDGDCYHAALGVAHAGQRARLVHQFHDPAAVDVAGVVGVFGLHQLRQADARSADGFGGQGVCHGKGRILNSEF